jgi:hypothetical protein
VAPNEPAAFLHSDKAAGSRGFQDGLRIETATLVCDLRIQLLRVSPDTHGWPQVKRESPYAAKKVVHSGGTLRAG